MNRDEAKFILRAYRMNGEDAQDPQFREALALAKHDPELSEWLRQEQAVDRRLAAKLGEFPVSPDLKSQLLAARKIVSFQPWWRRPAWLTAAAACAAVLLTIAALSLRIPEKAEFADFRSYVSAIAADRQGGLELMSRDVIEVREWLNNRQAPDDFVLPAGLQGLPSLGCRVLEWNGQKVSFVCFERENREKVHFFVMDVESIRGLPEVERLEMAVLKNGVSTISWRDDRRLYVLAGHQDEEELRRLL